MPAKQAVAASVALACLLFVASAAPPVSAQSGSSESGVHIVSVTGVDTNGNGRYESLRVDFTMDVTAAGNFAFATEVRAGPSSGGAILARTRVTANLGVGAQNFSTSVLGAAIYLSNVDGPYMVLLSPETVDDRGVSFEVDPSLAAEAVTPAWLHTQFDPPWAAFGSPIIDSGLDADHDGLYEELVLHVPVVLSSRGPVQVSGYLETTGSTAAGVPSQESEIRIVDAGNFTWDVAFDGSSIRRLQTPGPYRVNLTLSLANLPIVAERVLPAIWTSYTTGTYASDEFEFPSISINAPSVNGTGLDTNGDGLAEFWDFQAPVTVYAPGNYALRLTLPVAEKALTASRLLWLPAGSQTVDLWISGVAVSRVPGHVFFASLFASPLDPLAQPGDAIQWMQPYPSIAFDRRYLENLTIEPSGPTGFCWLDAVDPSTRFTTDSLVYAPHHTYSTNVLALYNGTFDVYLGSCSGGLAAVQRITVSGPTMATVTQGAITPYAVQANVTPVAWNETHITTTTEWGSQSPLLRRVADEAGNWDGTADANELGLAAQALGVTPYPLGLSILAARGLEVIMDTTPLPIAELSLVSARGAADILSASSLTTQETATFHSANAPGPEPDLLRVRVPYATALTRTELRLNLSSFSGANVSAVTWMSTATTDVFPHGSTGFIWDANATVRSVGTDLWNVSMGGRPTSFLPATETADLGTLSLEVWIGFGTIAGPHHGSLGTTGWGIDPVLLILVVSAAAGVTAAVFWIRRPKGGTESPSPGSREP